MKATTFSLALLLCALAMPAWAQFQQHNSIQHSQTMHQYIVHEAFRLLQRLDPLAAARLDAHIDDARSPRNTGGKPWDAKTVLAGAWREDAEDVVYGYGSANRAQWPQFTLSEKSGTPSYLYKELKKALSDDAGFQDGLVTCTHFWDANSSSRELFKDGIIIEGTGLLNWLSTRNQNIRILPQFHAWDKAQRMFRPNGQIAIRDKWWDGGDRLERNNSAGYVILPPQQHAAEEVAIRYQSLVQLFNTGECSMDIPGMQAPVNVILDREQRKRYVWEMLGRLCHLLADMSVPAHTHRDIHMGNLYLGNKLVDTQYLTIIINDRDSYENWIGCGYHAWWNADNIQGGLLDLSAHSDPLFFLFNSMRERGASFASDDAHGQGPNAGLPRSINDIPDRYVLSDNYSEAKHALMRNIRDHTLPYAIRATATLLAWFVHQLDMPESFEVRNVGAAGYTDFFYRPDITSPFPVWGMMSGTRFKKQVGDPLSLRSHYAMHPTTDAKFTAWQTPQAFLTSNHQYDDKVRNNQSNIECNYAYSERHIVPTLQIVGDHGQVITSDYPSFRNPWQVNPSLTHAWDVHQSTEFRQYQPQESATSNGGIFLQNYKLNESSLPHYSIRASRIWDRNTLAHKWPMPDVGDYIFQRWEPIYAELHDEYFNQLSPPHPDFPDPAQYDTRTVNFLQNSAIVNAHVKAHRSSIGAAPPSALNSQRKVARAANGAYHAVYESGGRVWYINSSDKGYTWSPEIPVTDEGSHAQRPSIAAVGDVALITCMVNNCVELFSMQDGEWKRFYAAPVAMFADAAPVLAVLDVEPRSVDQSAIAALVWEDTHALRFSLFSNGNALVDNQILTRGTQHAQSVDQPRYPSIAASVLPVTQHNSVQSFHVAWIENGSIFHIEIPVDRGVRPPRIPGYTPGNTLYREVVHARSGSAGLSYPARHAPSIAVNDLGQVFVAFDVLTWLSPWPVIGSTPPAPANVFALRERPASLAHVSTWNTTATIVSAANPGIPLAAPSVGARPCPYPGPKASKSTSLRITYNDRLGLLRTVKIDPGLSIEYHDDGMDPSMTVWSGQLDGLLNVFSTPAAAPYDYHLLSSRNQLSKQQSEQHTVRMREILLARDEGFSVFGISDLRIIDGEERSDIDWAPEHDSLQLGLNATVAGKMRSASFPAKHGATLRFRVQRYAHALADVAVSFIIRLRDAVTDEVLRLLDFPADDSDAIARLEARAFDLSMFDGRELYLDADAINTGEQHRIDIADRYALVDAQDYDEHIDSDIAIDGAAPLQLQNSPNPFNPSTVIRFTLPAAARARLAVHDLLGREIAVLLDGQLDAGAHHAVFDAAGLPSGVYIYQLIAGGRAVTRSMHLLK